MWTLAEAGANGGWQLSVGEVCTASSPLSPVFLQVHSPVALNAANRQGAGAFPLPPGQSQWVRQEWASPHAGLQGTKLLSSDSEKAVSFVA